MNTVAQDLQKAGQVALSIVDGKYVVEGLADLSKAATVISTVIAEHTELQKTLTTVVSDGAALALAIGKVIVEKGTSWSDDAQLIAAMKDFFTTDINTILLPEFVKVFGELKADIDPKATTVTTTVTTTVPAAI